MATAMCTGTAGSSEARTLFGTMGTEDIILQTATSMAIPTLFSVHLQPYLIPVPFIQETGSTGVVVDILPRPIRLQTKPMEKYSGIAYSQRTGVLPCIH